MTKDHQNWEGAYLDAALEVHAQAMPERVRSARDAIAGRLKKLEGSSNHHAERRQMESALRCLTALEEDVRRWNEQAA